MLASGSNTPCRRKSLFFLAVRSRSRSRSRPLLRLQRLRSELTFLPLPLVDSFSPLPFSASFLHIHLVAEAFHVALLPASSLLLYNYILDLSLAKDSILQSHTSVRIQISHGIATCRVSSASSSRAASPDSARHKSARCNHGFIG